MAGPALPRNEILVPKLRDLFFRRGAKGDPVWIPSRYKVAHGGRGSGKCLKLGTLVMMANGSLRPVEQVKVGDRVMGPDSGPRTVLGTTRGTGPLWTVKQTSGQDYVVNDAHILSLRKNRSCVNDVGERFPSGNYRRPRGRYPDEPDVLNIGVGAFAQKSARFRENFRGYRAGLLRFCAKPVGVDPYLLGLWLGDGSKHALQITSADTEVKDWLRGYCAAAGLHYVEYQKTGTEAKTIGLGRVCASHGRINPVWAAFKKLGLPFNKHVPLEYIANSEAVRLELLAGIVDSDGYFDKRGTFQVAQVSEALARGIKHLADTLGFRTSITTKSTICTNNGVRGEAWVVGISGDIDRVPCRVARKRCPPLKANKDKMLSMVSVEPAGFGEYAGFELDGDHLFCLEDGTVTHNSQSFAGLIVELAARRPIRVLCGREIQDSIADSVHQVLADQVERFGYGPWFDVQRDAIYSRVGAKIVFAGVRNNVTKIKSMQGIDILWLEEADKVSETSWKVLIPTIRKDGSEIWVSFNPNEERDPTFQRFVLKPPPDARVAQVNWSDNPWFPEVLDKERRYMLETDPEAYANVWDGQCTTRSDAQIFAGKWVVSAFETPTVGAPGVKGPYYGIDWGFSQDPSVLIKCWIVDADLLIEHEAYGVQVDLDSLPKLFDKVPGAREDVAYADSARPETIRHLNMHGYPRIKPVDKWPGSVEDGIQFIRSFKRVVIHPRCEHTRIEARHYRFKVDKDTEEVTSQIIDKNNHCWDSARYALAPYIRRRNHAALLLGAAG